MKTYGLYHKYPCRNLPKGSCSLHSLHGRVSAFSNMSFLSVIKGGGKVGNTSDVKWGMSDPLYRHRTSMDRSRPVQTPGVKMLWMRWRQAWPCLFSRSCSLDVSDMHARGSTCDCFHATCHFLRVACPYILVTIETEICGISALRLSLHRALNRYQSVLFSARFCSPCLTLVHPTGLPHPQLTASDIFSP